MRLLLDTQIVLRALTGSSRLGTVASKLIADPANEVYVSIASIWEIAIKHVRARRHADQRCPRGRTLCWAGYRELPVAWRHTPHLDTLPPLNGDPFDRILVAQAEVKPMRLLSCDATLASYGAMVLPV